MNRFIASSYAKGVSSGSSLNSSKKPVRPWLVSIIETAEVIIEFPDYIVRDVPISLSSMRSPWKRKSLILGWNTFANFEKAGYF
jgi:hypothetical protein